MSGATPYRETHGDPSTSSTTAAATPHTETRAYPNVFGARVEYQAECQFVFEGGPDLETLAGDCKKNPGHKNFIPIQEFLNQKNGYLDDLKDLYDVRDMADMTVRVVGHTVSNDRPDVYPNSPIPFPYRKYKGMGNLKFFGTGFIDPRGQNMLSTFSAAKGGACPCKICRESKQEAPLYYEVIVTTAAHVVFNEEEALDAAFECFYDNEDREGVKLLHGISVKSCPELDISFVTCVTHEREFFVKLCTAINCSSVKKWISVDIQHSVDFKALVISHPHGGSKHVTMGRLLHRDFHATSSDSITTHFRLPLSIVTHESFNPVPGAEEVPGMDAQYRYYKLPEGATWILPETDTRSGVQFMSMYFIKAPAGTRIKLPGEQQQQVDCPADAEIRWWRLHPQVAYDVSTCPGSSGAPLLYWEDPEKKLFEGVCHCGDVNGTNVSSFGEMRLYSIDGINFLPVLAEVAAAN